MTVDTTLVNKANRSLTSVQAETAYTDYTAIAKARLDQDDPGLSPALYDWCHALMICHLYASGDPVTGLKSFTSGDFSGSQNAGVTIWILEYRQIIDNFQVDEDTAEGDVLRADAKMDAMKLDQAEIPRYYTGVG